eukprot:m.128105 g.128105  ORF g.128105 m.128105 type:complete len:599 (-) comp29314_c0_seq1:618-2414(-)
MAGPPTKGDIYKAMYAHLEAGSKEELTFQIGDTFRLLKTPKDESESWWFVQSMQGRKPKGYVPGNCMAAEDSLDHFEWCHGAINRSAAEFLLVKAATNGAYLVRESQSKPGEYTLSLYDDAVAHYRINQQPDGRCFIRAKQSFDSIHELIEHHKNSTSGLPVVLSMVIPKMHAHAIVISKHLDDAWELPRKDIKLGKMLGAGNYGEVYKASYAREKDKMVVAVKTVKEDSMGIEEFMREAQVMKQMKHPNLVRLIGVCSAELPMYIVTEMVPHGDLLSYLRKQTSAKEINTKAKLYISSQVADGMSYLENKNVIHRDLAARNCLVADDLVIKIADFGMGRVIDDLYTAKTGSKMPVKWSAPESLCYNAFSSASDVWSFGILLWEVVTLGNNPYPDIESKDVLNKLESDYRMPEPSNCPMGMYSEMKSCWMMRAEDRPSFKQLAENLDKLLDAKVGNDDRVRKATNAASRPKPPPTNNWKESYEKSDSGMSQISLQELIDVTKEGYGLASNIVRYGDQNIVKDQVKKLISVMSRLFDGIQPLTKDNLSLKTTMKAMMQNITPIQKMASAPKLEKVQPFVEKIRNLIREMNKHLKSLKGK